MSKLPIVEFHILQSFPVSCLNRDDVGSPKSVVIGGVQRSRVSSQCWKRAIRMKMHELNCPISLHTKNLADVFYKKCQSDNEVDTEKLKAATKALADQIIAKDAIIFLSQAEVQDLVNLLQENQFSEKIDLKPFIKAHKKGQQMDAADIALFGRMVAKQNDLTIEGACSVAHAVTTHRANTELDFYTAVADEDDADDKTNAGAAFVGISEYTAGTFYRYICLDVQQLADNLYTEADDLSQLKEVVGLFTLALFSAVPAARQHTMTAMCPWNYAQILVRDGQGIQVPFEEAIKSNNGYLKPSISYLKEKLNAYKAMYGDKLYGLRQAIEFTDDGKMSVDNLIKIICEAF